MANLSALPGMIRRAVVTSQVGGTYPSSALGVSSSSGAYGSWTQVVSSGTLASHALTGVSISGATATSPNFKLQIGVGAVGSEGSKYEWSAYYTPANDFVNVVPAVLIPENERVAVRIQQGAATTTNFIICQFTPRPF